MKEKGEKKGKKGGVVKKVPSIPSGIQWEKKKTPLFFFITFFFIQTFFFLFLIFSNPNFHDRGKKTVGLLLLEAKIFSGILISSLDSHHGAISGKERRVFFLSFQFLLFCF